MKKGLQRRRVVPVFPELFQYLQLQVLHLERVPEVACLVVVDQPDMFGFGVLDGCGQVRVVGNLQNDLNVVDAIQLFVVGGGWYSGRLGIPVPFRLGVDVHDATDARLGWRQILLPEKAQQFVTEQTATDKTDDTIAETGNVRMVRVPRGKWFQGFHAPFPLMLKKRSM